METLIIDIQRCSVHDGPGIRTSVFLKGCPLRCLWCHNPESQSFQKELSFHRDLCSLCGACVQACPAGVHRIENGRHMTDHSACIQCGRCVEACPSHALSLVGVPMSPDEVFEVILKDEVFYREGNGGVTISGGEALAHPDFCSALLKLCRQRHIHTCVETSGFSPRSSLDAIADDTDLFLFDCKITDPDAAADTIGDPLLQIQENFQYLYDRQKEIVMRCPVIPTVNDTRSHFDNIIELVKSHPQLAGVELLPYHTFGISKALDTGRAPVHFPVPTEEMIQGWLAYFHQNGCPSVSLG